MQTFINDSIPPLCMDTTLFRVLLEVCGPSRLNSGMVNPIKAIKALQKRNVENALGILTSDEYNQRMNKHLDSAESFLSKGDLDSAFIDYANVLQLSRYEIEGKPNICLSCNPRKDDLVYKVLEHISELGRYNPNPAVLMGDGRERIRGKCIIDEHQMIEILTRIYDSVLKSYKKEFSKRVESEIPRKIGFCYQSLGDYRNARNWFHKGVKIDPTNEPLLRNFQRYGDMKKMKQVLRRALG